MAEAPVIALKNLKLSLGDMDLFRGVDMNILARDRICLVGRNGSGKSTLLKMIAGIQDFDDGEIFRQPGVSTAYLPQEPDVSGFDTALEYVCEGLDDHETYMGEMYLQAVQVDPAAKCSGLSGGETRRAAIAKLLCSQADILLLDEPTNHLDLPTILWLEEELANFAGGFVVISHDRSFLKRLTKKTCWLDRGQMKAMDKGFAHFEQWAEDIYNQEEQETTKLNKQIAQETEWSRQGVKARLKRNQGRLKRLHSMREERSLMIARTGRASATIDSGDMSSKIVVEAKDISLSYGERVIFHPVNLKILRGDRVGIVGPNGVGKSSLIKVLTKELAPDTGTVRVGKTLEMSYLDQKRSVLNENQSIWDTLCETGGEYVTVQGRPRHVVSYMKDFMFKETQARSPVSSLSGGERNRLLLAKTLTKASNFLVLDEPTNDLDVETLDLLQELLDDFTGTLVLVSHDRDFLDRICTSVLAMEGDGRVTEYAGGYTDYVHQKKLAERTEKEDKTDAKKNIVAKEPAQNATAKPEKKTKKIKL
jgi:ATP-binding cassette subfamily F protein uup